MRQSTNNSNCSSQVQPPKIRKAIIFQQQLKSLFANLSLHQKEERVLKMLRFCCIPKLKLPLGIQKSGFSVAEPVMTFDSTSNNCFQDISEFSWKNITIKSNSFIDCTPFYILGPDKSGQFVIQQRLSILRFKKSMKSCPLKEKKGIGARILAQQQMDSHSKKLSEIYRKRSKVHEGQLGEMGRTLVKTSRAKHEDMEHRRNINHLYQFISRPKSMADRLKDPNDFFAYPALFFREVAASPRPRLAKGKRKPSGNRKAKTQAVGDGAEHKYGIDSQTVNEQLPILQNFTEQQLEEYTDKITRMIYNYNLNSKERVLYLKSCVLATLHPHYPPQFADVVEEIFEEILKSMNL